MAEANEEPRKIQYPPDRRSYRKLDLISKGLSTFVHKAICMPMDSSVVAIKDIHYIDQYSRPIFDLLSHPNLLKPHCTFRVDGSRLWFVMPFMSAGSLRSIISSSFPDGLSEPCIAIVLRETLNALVYLHDKGYHHRDIKPGNILLDSDGSVKLADFGLSASIYEPNSLIEISGKPYWMAPEVIHGTMADIWSFGITALELAHGQPPLSNLPPWKAMIFKINSRFGLPDYEKKKNDQKWFSKSFRQMVVSCLVKDPSRRPTAYELLNHPFFKNCHSTPDFLVKNMLQGLPSVEERFTQSLLHPPPSVADVGSPFKRSRISAWYLNEHELKLDPVFLTKREEPINSKLKQVRRKINFDIEGENPPEVDEHTALISDYLDIRRIIDEQIMPNLLTQLRGDFPEELLQQMEQGLKKTKQLNMELERTCRSGEYGDDSSSSSQ